MHQPRVPHVSAGRRGLPCWSFAFEAMLVEAKLLLPVVRCELELTSRDWLVVDVQSSAARGRQVPSLPTLVAQEVSSTARRWLRGRRRLIGCRQQLEEVLVAPEQVQERSKLIAGCEQLHLLLKILRCSCRPVQAETHQGLKGFDGCFLPVHCISCPQSKIERLQGLLGG